MRRATVRVAAAVLLATALLASAPAATRVAAAASGTASIVTVEATAVDGQLTVHAATRETADRTLALARAGVDALSYRFPSADGIPIVIVVVEDPKEYELVQPAPMTRGFATFGGNRIYLRGADLDQEVVTHELAHILLGKHIRRGLVVPDWFNEGFAQYVSGSNGHRLEIFYTVASGDLLTIPELDRIDALDDPDRELATIEGLAIVEFLVDRYGEEALWHLVSGLARAETFNQALFETYGRSDLELSEDWMTYAAEEYGILSIVGLETLGTAALGLLALFAAAVWAANKIRLRATPGSPTDLSEWEVMEAEYAAASLDVEHPAGGHAPGDPAPGEHTPGDGPPDDEAPVLGPEDGGGFLRRPGVSGDSRLPRPGRDRSRPGRDP